MLFDQFVLCIIVYIYICTYFPPVRHRVYLYVRSQFNYDKDSKTMVWNHCLSHPYVLTLRAGELQRNLAHAYIKYFTVP